MDESRQFQEWWKENGTRWFKVAEPWDDPAFYPGREPAEAAFHAGAEAQRQVGPCGKHPLACWVERVLPVHVRSNLAIEGGSEITHCCTVCASEQALRAEIDAAKERYEKAETQLAGCGVAALGWNDNPAKQGDWGWSPSYQDVLTLRKNWESQRAEIATRDATIAKLESLIEVKTNNYAAMSDSEFGLRSQLFAREAELTTLRDKLWEMEARVTFLNSWLTKLKESSDDMTKDIAALLAEEAGR